MSGVSRVSHIEATEAWAPCDTIAPVFQFKSFLITMYCTRVSSGAAAEEEAADDAAAPVPASPAAAAEVEDEEEEEEEEDMVEVKCNERG